MMQPEKSGVGVIVGRFQEKDLSDAHKELIQYSINHHNSTIVILGESRARTTKHDPLNYEMRRQMILQEFPDVLILSILDTRGDLEWSKNLDSLISRNVPPHTEVTLYGSRDSFLESYVGKYKTQKLSIAGTMSSTIRRKIDGEQIINSVDFRHGVIWATQSQYNSVVPCVDIAPVTKSGVVFIKKNEDNGMLRFAGGHVENGTLEENAIREMQEETGIYEEARAEYVGSFVIDDWRYRHDQKVITSLFMVRVSGNSMGAGDDADEIVVVTLSDIIRGKFNIVPEHRDMLSKLIAYIGE